MPVASIHVIGDSDSDRRGSEELAKAGLATMQKQIPELGRTISDGLGSRLASQFAHSGVKCRAWRLRQLWLLAESRCTTSLIRNGTVQLHNRPMRPQVCHLPRMLRSAFVHFNSSRCLVPECSQGFCVTLTATDSLSMLACNMFVGAA